MDTAGVTKGLEAEVVVIGAGLAGLAAATGLMRRGIDVLLVDPRLKAAPSFKAEKLELAQAQLLDGFGLLAPIEPLCGRIEHVVTTRGAHHLATMQMRQWGIPYHDLVNGLREALPPGLRMHIARVARVDTSDDVQRLLLDDGTQVRTRLVVLAAGVNARLAADLGISRRMVSERHSLTAGVTVERTDGQPFDFDALTVYPVMPGRTAYLSFFKIAEGMRVNVFTFYDIESVWARRFRTDPIGAIEEAIPDTQKVAGALRATSKPVLGPIDLWTVEAPARAGVVLIGDAFQSVCPSTGSGLSKALTDADVLVHDCSTEWLRTPGMGVDKITRYYRNPRKLQADVDSLDAALYRRRITLERSLKLTLHRERVFLGMRAAASLAWFAHLFE